jgi:hypothetical protein
MDERPRPPLYRRLYTRNSAEKRKTAISHWGLVSIMRHSGDDDDVKWEQGRRSPEGKFKYRHLLKSITI